MYKSFSMETREWYRRHSVEAPGKEGVAGLLEVHFVRGCCASLAEAANLPLLLLNMGKNNVNISLFKFCKFIY